MRPEWDMETRELFEAFERMHEAHRTGDVDTFSKYVSANFHEAGADNGMISFHPDGVDENRVKAAFKAGLTMRWTVHHPEIYFYGATRDVAVITCYFRGYIGTNKGGEAGTWRNTSVWTKAGGTWKTVHNHVSPLVASRSESGGQADLKLSYLSESPVHGGDG